MSENVENTHRKPRRKWLFLSIIILVSAIVGGCITATTHHFIVKRAHHAFHTMDQPTAERKAERAARYFSKRVKATPEQREKLIAISKSLVSDLLPYRQKLKGTRKQIRGLLTQETIDREKIEALRAEKFTLMEEISKRVTTALTDAAEILTPEQRKKVSKYLLRKRSRWQ